MRRALLSLILPVLCAGLPTAAQAAALSVCVDENPWPPYTYWQDGADNLPHFQGFTVDLADSLLRSLGRDYRIQRLPWPEVHRRAADPDGHDCDVVWDISSTPERERYLSFSEPLYKLRYTLMYDRQRFRQGAPLQGLSDLDKYRVCGVRDYNYGSLQNSINLLRFDSIRAALGAITSNRCDFFLIEASVLARGREMGIYHTDGLDCVLLDSLNKAYRLAVARRLPDADTLAANLQGALEKAQRSGLSARLATRYHLAEPVCRQQLR